MDKPQIAAEITRIALANDGKAPGREKFERETGIKMHEWYSHLWLRWGDALQEAGFAPNKLATALNSGIVVGKYIELIRELGRLPSRWRGASKGKARLIVSEPQGVCPFRWKIKPHCKDSRILQSPFRFR